METEKSKMIIEYILFCLNVITWLICVILIGICFWVRFDPEITDWIEKLEVKQFYTGLYILIVCALAHIASGVISCMGTFSENKRLLAVNIVAQILLFILCLAGAAVLMENSSFKSSIHHAIKNIMVGLIQLYPSYEPANKILATIQESVGCCGGEGYNDYIRLHRALPSECRDSVTGHTHYYSCADSISWILEGRSSWITGLAILLCAKKMLNAVLSTVLIHLINLSQDQ
ncbi:unnamed protein product [Nezara viridula]|uniref:Tetraspanin n=1 Tax=Nezara viridula TaxID=85310 RepID=A0A9P0EFY5_NEZVI|nr:unnamed protein product [Nezara viridula]